MNYKNETDRICRFIKDYISQIKKKGVVLGISGGIDSAVVAVLAKRSLGANAMKMYYLPELSEPHNYDCLHIDKLCKRFDLRYEIFDIHSVLSAFGVFNNNVDNNNEYNYKIMTIANLKSRIRMCYLYMIASEYNMIVIGTTNKSEMDIGYFTKYGDGGVDIEPIAHLYKTEVFNLAKYLDIPNCIVDKKPTTGLWENQFDEDEIGMSYKKLDDILEYINHNQITDIQSNYKDLHFYTDYDKDGNWVEDGYGMFTESELEHVINLIKNSAHKRNQIPHLE